MRHQSCQRQGFTVIELITSCAILLALVAATGLVVSRMMQHRASLAQRAIATEALANLMEKIDGIETASLANDDLTAIQLPEYVGKAIPDAALTIDSQPVESPAGIRIACQITWPDKHSNGSVKAAIWKFPHEDNAAASRDTGDAKDDAKDIEDADEPYSATKTDNKNLQDADDEKSPTEEVAP